MVRARFGRTVMTAVSILAVSSTASFAVQGDPVEPYDVEPKSAVEAVSNDRLDEAHGVLVADETLQKTRPVWTPEAIEFKPREPRGDRPIARALAAFFQAIGGVLGYLLIALIAAAILYGLYLVFGESITLRGRQKTKTADADISTVTNLQPQKAEAEALLADADALAAQGRFAEAVHMLLFRSIRDIQEKRLGVIGKSLTAREIGALGSLPQSLRSALSPIIAIVERSFFGGREVDEAGWVSARASYQSFAFGSGAE